MGRKLEQEPFPELTNDDDCWRGELELPAWKNFWDHCEGRCALTTVYLTVDCEHRKKPTAAQAAACGLAIKHANKIRDGILDLMLPYMQKIAGRVRYRRRLGSISASRSRIRSNYVGCCPAQS